MRPSRRVGPAPRARAGLALACLALVIACDRAESRRAEDPGPAREAVVLLHGLGRTERSMRPLAEHLSEAGFASHNFDYPSREEPPEVLVDRLAAWVATCCSDAPALHFVGHSLGGLLARALVAESPPPNVGRLVMLGPPNQGSEIVDTLGDSAWFERVMGPSATQLGTDAESYPQRLPPPRIEVGVIAGTRTVNPVGSLILPEEDDGMVSLDSTRLPGMTDYLVVARSHALIMQAPEVLEQVVHFLREGRFQHASQGEPAPEAP